jgi:hypothetical protein
MDYHQPAMFHIVPSGDYLHVVCAKCEEACELDYRGRDPVVVLVEITCPRCGGSGKWKLHWAGEGFGEPWKPKTRVSTTLPDGTY